MTEEAFKYYNHIKYFVAEFDATLRKIGDSMGVIVPHRIIEQLGAYPGQRLRIVIPERVDWSSVWAKFRTKTSTSALIRRSRTPRD